MWKSEPLISMNVESLACKLGELGNFPTQPLLKMALFSYNILIQIGGHFADY